MAKAVKLADIAESLGVSAVTVSKALSGRKGVSEEMREKIVKLADELGYKQPSVTRKNMTNKKSYTIAVLIHEKYFDKYDSFYLQVYQNLTTKAISKGCFTLMETISEEAERSCEIPKVVQESKADGIIMVGKFEREYCEFINKECGDVPCIYLDFCDTRINVDAVISDSFYGAYYLTNYLFEMGHTQIGYVGNLLATGSITDRYLGYVKALMEHGIDIKKEWIINDRAGLAGDILPPDKFMLPNEMPTAFVCNCDLTASVFIKRLEDEGYRVPNDISVVGYDNYLYPGVCNVEITTYEVDIKEMAKKAINILIKKMCGETYRRCIHIVEGHIVLKNSVKKLNE